MKKELTEHDEKYSSINTISDRLRDFEWHFLGLLTILVLVTGFIGFDHYFSALEQRVSYFDLIYLTLQLFVLESGSVFGPVGWQLELARFLAPAIAAYAAIKAVMHIFRDQLQLLRIRFIKNHVVICGLGRKGYLLSKEFRKRGYKRIVIELDEDNDFIQPCRNQGDIVLIGNGADTEMLRKARVSKANILIAICGDDGTNADITVLTSDLVKKRKGNALTAFVHIVDPQLCYLLKEREIELGKVDAFRVEFYNSFDLGARAWLDQFQVFDDKGKIDGSTPHLLLVGIGKLGQSLLTHLGRQWNWLKLQNGTKLQVTVIDKNAQSKITSLCLQYPGLNKICQLHGLDMDIHSPEFLKGDFLFDDRGECEITSAFVCLDHDSFAFTTGLALYQHLRQGPEIVIRMTHNTGLAKLLEEEAPKSTLINLKAFSLLDETCRPSLLFEGIHEILAREIHSNYCQQRQELKTQNKSDPAMVSWEKLPENLRESNRKQADHLSLKLNAVGCTIAPLTNWDENLFEFNDDEIELLAKMEHKRWVEERKNEGWKYSPKPKNLKKKTSPYLVDWDKLPTKEENPEKVDIKDFDRSAVQNIPVFLARAGFKIIRKK